NRSPSGDDDGDRDRDDRGRFPRMGSAGMSLRMSICAVVSLGLTVGAHWVAGQAAQAPSTASQDQGPPRIPGVPAPKNPPPTAAIPAPAAAGAASTPPRVASPADPSP